MGVVVHLLGRPRIDRSDGPSYQFRSNKSWGLLAHLLLAERPSTRSRLATLLFAEAKDPARAFRWSLAEIRRGLYGAGSVDGDPVRLQLDPDTVVDVLTVLNGRWPQAIGLPGLGSSLLDGMTFRGADGFEAWFLAAQRRVAAGTESVLHEAALAALAVGQWEEAIGHAAQATALNPLDENFQALLIRLYRLAGDPDAAARQLAACTELLDRELGVAPRPAVAAAARVALPATPDRDVAPEASIVDEVQARTLLEAGSAAIAAGAIDAGMQTLRAALEVADRSGADLLRVRARRELGQALVHGVRGMDEEGLGLLWEATEIAQAHGWGAEVAQAMAERGYVDFLRARYDRAELALTDAIRLADGTASTIAKAATYLGCVASDRADYGRAIELLGQGIDHARLALDPRREAYARCMLGRVHLLTGDLDAATADLDESRELAERERWLTFVPWPQALRAQVALARGDAAGADAMLREAFARACQLGDPCWEGVAARGLALVAEARGNPGEAFRLLADARRRADRLPDGYTWLDGYILAAQCELGRRHGHPTTADWIAELQALSARTGMRGFLVEALRHGAVLGQPGGAAAAAMFDRPTALTGPAG